jgi:hypothetical protein
MFFILCTGKHVFPFQYRLSEKLPCSMEGYR